MDTRKFLCKSLAVCIVIASGCNIQERKLSIAENENTESSSMPSSSISSGISFSEKEKNLNVESSSENGPDPGKKFIEKTTPLPPPRVKIENLDFTTMSVDDLKPILQQVLDRAVYFCKIAYLSEFIPYTRTDKIVRSFRDEQWDFYPCMDFPYTSVEELKQDVLTVFTPDTLENESALIHVFDSLTDYNGKIYMPADLFGQAYFAVWDVENMEIIEVTPTRLLVSMPVTCMEGSFISSLAFQYEDGNILIGRDFFARKDD